MHVKDPSVQLRPIISPGLHPRANRAPASAALDSHTLPIIFGAIGAGLTLATIIIAIIQLRSMQRRYSNNDVEASQNEVEMGPVGGQEAQGAAAT